MNSCFKGFFRFLIFALPLTSCHVGRYFYWNYATIKDHKKFPSETIYKGEDVFQFEPNSSGTALKVPPQFLQGEKQQTLGEFLEQHKTVAFIVIKNDTILMEEYFNGYAPEDIINSFSVTKSFVSALVGIAIEEGLIRSADQPITDFLPELAKNDPRFGKITLDHLLNMRSGLKFNEGYANPFADMAKYYYGTNLKKYITQLKIERQPNEAYNYISANTQLLGMALE
ncbi:MAG: class C beta-lactamase-related serine hydrolase, partial [Candidatus Moranbacteria bacterium]|nr:class C beta-lactamase-related serine hydrolase [Candidatus Moranbacteria bacterium]